MFSKRNLVDIKKSTLKLQDPKKDLATRIKHLKIILDNVDSAESKGLFEANFSHVYSILYDSFIQTETNLRQRELSFHLVHKAHKEELENTLWILEQILSLLPELIHKRWQLHSLGRLLTKILHPGNALKLRRQALKFFLMWYQALNDNSPEYVHNMFASLVPDMKANEELHQSLGNSASVFHEHPVSAAELLPILPPSNTEKSPEDPGKFFLEALLEHMVHTVVKLEWHDKTAHHHLCFNFLLERFKLHYLPKIFPTFCTETSLYRPNLDLPMMRRVEQGESEAMQSRRVTLIMWIANYMHQTKKQNQEVWGNMNNHASSHNSSNNDDDNSQHESSHPSLDSTVSIQTNKTATDEELAAQIVRDVLCGSRDNVNFIHEVYRQAFLLNFNHVIAIRKVIALYKDLIQGNVVETPRYALELPDEESGDSGVDEASSPSNDLNSVRRLRNDSYLGAIHKENLLVRSGMQNVYQLFVTHAANVFLLEVNANTPKMLEEQTDACKRVLNIYRFMVMNTRMDSSTWKQLLLVLLQITSLVLGDTPPPKKRRQCLGGKLAPAIFQTLIVTWIKANLNVMISKELWDRFLLVLSSLTCWEELIKEWAKTLETLTRVLARHVYNLDLTDLPLERRLTEQKSKRGIGRRMTTCQVDSNSSPLPCSLPSSAASDHHRQAVCRQDSSLPADDDRHSVQSDKIRPCLTRSLSESSLTLVALKRNQHQQSAITKSQRNRDRHSRSRSLDLGFTSWSLESTDRTRSPSPAPSGGLESQNSMKDSPIQLDMISSPPESVIGGVDFHNQGDNKGVVCGGNIRGWLPDVAVILWRRMLGALGDVNVTIMDPKLHCQVFEYLIKLTDTLIKIKQNQGISADKLSTPQPPELIPPLTLILPWCFGALMLQHATNFDSGKQNALRLLCTVTVNCDTKHRNYLPQFYRFLHSALTGGASNSALNTCLKHLGPRFLSLQLPGSSLLLLDLVHACNTVLNSIDNLDSSPRTEAVAILANLLSQPDDLSSINVLRPEPAAISIVSCPDIKEHVVSILLRAGRREPTGKARCIALSALAMFVHKELANQTYHAKVPDALNVLLLALRFKNKIIAHLTSDCLFSLCEHAPLLWTQYPRLGNSVIRTLCSALLLHVHDVLIKDSSGPNETDKALGTALLLCLGEWCMKLGPSRLMEVSEYGDLRGTCLLLQVFTVLDKISNIGGDTTSTEKLANNSENRLRVNDEDHDNDFDPNIISDDLSRQLHQSARRKSGEECRKALILCSRTILAHLVTHLGHFPMAIGAARLSSLVVEHDDVPNLSPNDLATSSSGAVISASNIQLFILTKNVIASLIELPALDLPGGGVTAGLSTADQQVRVLLRDLSGKASWDASILYKCPDTNAVVQRGNDYSVENVTVTVENTNKWDPPSFQPESLMISSGHLFPERAMRHRSPNILPDTSNSAPDLDQLDDLLQYLGHTSPECLEDFGRKLNEPAYAPMSTEVEQEAIQSVIHQRDMELEESRCLQQSFDTSMQAVVRPSSRNDASIVKDDRQEHSSDFQQCRVLFSQLGLAGWERRQQLHLLNKTEKLLRELRNLDAQSCRETHKVAVIYVGPGQEDKTSILSNQGGSAAYEQFLAALAWEIELEGHTGFMGGLNGQGSNGLTAPYMASSFSETIFHVATRMPGETAEAVLNKTRHLGNDEVHIVWSEHWRDYRRDIIPTEFCDILITIYPLGNNLNRVTIDCKADVPHFGVLFNEAIVESNILAGLVRATTICASRAKRATYEFYQHYYEERSRSLDTVVGKHKNSTTYEEFISRVYCPSTKSSFISGGGNSSDNGTSGSPSMLAAALLDAQGHSFGKGRGVSEVTTKGVWFTHHQENMESSTTNISPRPLKKLSANLKNSRRSLRHENSVTESPSSPAESPTAITKKK